MKRRCNPKLDAPGLHRSGTASRSAGEGKRSSKRKPDWRKAPPGPSRYKEQFGIIIICRNEADQKRTFSLAKQRFWAHEVKVVTT